MKNSSRCALWAVVVVTLAGCGGRTVETEGNRSAPAPPAVADRSAVAADSSAVATDVPALVVARTTNLPSPVSLAEDDWPQFRGVARDGRSRVTGLASVWPSEGPPVLWKVAVAQGYAAPSVVGGRVYFNDYDESRNVWMVRCFSLNDGHEFWRYEVAKRIRPNHGITRTAPATDGGFVVAIDPKCEVHCLDARDGSLVWRLNLPVAYGCTIPPWYNGQCPLLQDGRLILGVGGRALMAALDLATGKPVWETPNAEAWPLSHASVAPLEIDGTAQYAYLTLKGAVGVDAARGQVLWTFPWQFNMAVTTCPVPLGDGRLLLTAGYDTQTVICRVRRDGDMWKTEEWKALPSPTAGWNSEVQTPIVHQGQIYGVGKKQRGLWTCLDDSGNELWTSRGAASFGMGGYAFVDDKFLVLDDRTGVLRVLDADANEYRELASAKVLEGPDVWAPPVVSQGKLLVRDLAQLVCLDLASGTPPSGQAPSVTPAAASAGSAPQSTNE